MAHNELTPEEIASKEDEAALAVSRVLEALTDDEYVDWLSHPERAASFTPATARAVESSLRDAHNERRLAAQVALRALDKLLIRALDALGKE
jgi:hypothetical protein